MTCSEEGCGRSAHSRTLCSTHYHTHRRAGTLERFPNINAQRKEAPTVVRPKARTFRWAAAECRVPGCGIPPMARDLCNKHYQHAKAEGTLHTYPKVRRVYVRTVCGVEGCEVQAVAHGRCQSHAAMHRRYGLSTAELGGLATACQVCGSTEALHVDHCHETGRVRGVLCRACNMGLGMLGDTPSRVRALLAYLDSA